VYHECIIKLDKTRIRFICRSDLSDGTQVWGSVKTAALFTGFRIESQGNDEIYCAVNLGHLMSAIKSGEQAKDMLVKLHKRGSQPVLHFSISFQSAPGAGSTDRPRHDIWQHVPVRVLNAEQIDSLRLPELAAAKVEIFLPPLRELRSIVERMRGISAHVTLSADMAGHLEVEFQSPLVSATTHYQGLQHPAAVDGAQPPDPGTQAECRVDIRRMWSFLHCHLLTPRSVLGCFIEGIALIFRVQTFEEGNLVFYLPCVT